MELSVIVPIYNEADNVGQLEAEISAALDGRYEYEVIYVDDGSSDGSGDLLAGLAAQHPNRCVIRFSRNYGQSAALSAGIAHATGDCLVFLDGDLQNDPKDILVLVERLNKGYDVVSGWRSPRRDKRLSRLVPSYIANHLISWITGLHLHDYGCTLKAYRRQSLAGFKLYGEMHRFIPAFAWWQGATVVEQVVHHRPRLRGRSKYGLSRTFKVLLDVLAVKFLCDYSTKPLHVFGGIGLASIAVSVVLGMFVLYQKLVDGIFAHRNPLLLLAMMVFLAGVQAFLMGLLAELAIRTYHESQAKTTYVIRDIIHSPKKRESSDRPVAGPS
jgi:glycosyltransferase involved in cell wall biosynthesis